MAARVSRFSDLSPRMFDALKKFPTHFDHVCGVRANTTYALERRGYVEHAPDDEDDWAMVAVGTLDAADAFTANLRMWRRTDAGTCEIARLMGGKD